MRASRRGPLTRALDVLVFGTCAVTVIALPGTRRGFAILLLLALAGWGYRYASQGLLPRLVGALAFGAGWVGYPLPALVVLWIVAFVVRAHRHDKARPQPSEKGDRARLTLRTALETPGRIRGFRVPFTSNAGPGAIPLLMAVAGREVGFYVETGEWNEDARRRFFDWIVRLRASELSGLPVEVRGSSPVPDEIVRAGRTDPEVLLELARRPPGPAPTEAS